MDSAERKSPDQHISVIDYETPESVRQLAVRNRALHQPQGRLREADVVLMRQRYEEGATVYELGVEFGVDRRTVSTRLKNAGVAMRLRSPTLQEIKLMANQLKAGVSLQSTSEQFGFCANTVRKSLRECQLGATSVIEHDR